MIEKINKRINQISTLLRQHNGMTVRELSREFAVSEQTIRRDLKQLERSNIITFVHGAAIYKGITLPNGQLGEYYVLLEKSVHNPEKERIAKAAMQLVAPGETIIVDIGTTAEHLVRFIPHNFSITVLCFTINVLFEIHKKNVENLIMGGGYYHANTQLFESRETLNLIRKTRANKYFMTAAGISKELGLTCANQYEIGIKEACIESSQQKILIADSTKFGQVKSIFFSTLEQVDRVITDDGISPEWVKIMEDMNITVQIV